MLPKCRVAIFLQRTALTNFLVSSVVKHMAVGTRGLGFESRIGQIGRNVAIRQRLASAATFLSSCVAQVPIREDGLATR